MILQGQLESQDFKVFATVVQRPETQIVVVLLNIGLNILLCTSAPNKVDLFDVTLVSCDGPKSCDLLTYFKYYGQTAPISL